MSNATREIVEKIFEQKNIEDITERAILYEEIIKIIIASLKERQRNYNLPDNDPHLKTMLESIVEEALRIYSQIDELKDKIMYWDKEWINDNFKIPRLRSIRINIPPFFGVTIRGDNDRSTTAKFMLFVNNLRKVNLLNISSQHGNVKTEGKPWISSDSNDLLIIGDRKFRKGYIRESSCTEPKIKAFFISNGEKDPYTFSHINLLKGAIMIVEYSTPSRLGESHSLFIKGIYKE